METQVLDFQIGDDGKYHLILPDDRVVGAARLEKSGFMDAEVLGIPFGEVLIGGAVAEGVNALVSITGLDKMIGGLIPGGSSSVLGSINIVDLLAAAGLAWFGKGRAWSKAGALFLTYAALEPAIHSLFAGLIPAPGLAQDAGPKAQATADSVEDWLRAGAN